MMIVEQPPELCRTIVIADDNDSLRSALVSALSAHGYKAIGVRNGREALKFLPQLDGPTLFFLDLMMPLLNGWDFLDFLRKEPNDRDLQIVMVSAVNSTSRPDRRAPSGIAASLPKPLSIKAVMEVVRKYCVHPVSYIIAETPALGFDEWDHRATARTTLN